jgi:hypothetical protein
VTRLFAEVYLDEDVSVVVGDMLEARGFSVVTTRDAGRLGATDIKQLEYASRHGKTLVTHNRVDFEELHKRYLEEDRESWGIIVLGRRRPGALVASLLKLLNQLTADEFRNQLLYA